MGLLDKLALSVKNYHHGRWTRSSRAKHTAIHAEELARLATLEARAYTDQAFQSQATNGEVSHDTLEKKTLLGVQEAKAYADGAVNGLSLSLGAVASAVVELSDKVDQLTGKPDLTAAHPVQGIEIKIQELDNRLGQLRSDQQNQQDTQNDSETLSKAQAAIGELSAQIEQISLALGRLDDQITNLSSKPEIVTTRRGDTASS